MLLTNLSTRIVADVAEDNDAEVKRHFRIEARLGERRVRFDVPAGRSTLMAWPTEHLGASALLYPGMTLKDHARAVIQLLSEDIDERVAVSVLTPRATPPRSATIITAALIGRDTAARIGKTIGQKTWNYWSRMPS